MNWIQGCLIIMDRSVLPQLRSSGVSLIMASAARGIDVGGALSSAQAIVVMVQG